MLIEAIRTTASIEKDGQFLAEAVPVAIDVTAGHRGALEEWGGTANMAAADANAFFLARVCRMVLADGRCGDVFATRVNGECVEFQVSGRLEQPGEDCMTPKDI